jgi:transcriptional regulator GlxA family with amidase domain
MKLAILALEGCMHSAISGVADILSLANHVMQQSGSKPGFAWQTLSLDGNAVRAGGGQMVAVDGAIGKRGRFDAILVPGNLVDHVTAERLQPQYARAGAWLRQQHANGRLIGAFCSGVFLLAGAACSTTAAPPSPGGCKASCGSVIPPSTSLPTPSSPPRTASSARPDRCRGSTSCSG